MDSPITVRRATLADREAISGFVRLAYPDRWQYKIPERWQWAYVDNPFLGPGGLPLWIAIDVQGRVVGQTGALVEPLRVEAQDLSVGWSVDTFLLPEYRGQGLGRALQKANDEANPIFMSLSMSDANRYIKSTLGSTPLEPVLTFVKTVQTQPKRALDALLERLNLRPGRVRSLAAWFFQAFRLDQSLAHRLTRRGARRDRKEFARISRSVQIEPAEEITPEFDRLWESVSTRYRALVRRDYRYLKWKYDDQPSTDYQRLIARRGGEICGRAIGA